MRTLNIFYYSRPIITTLPVAMVDTMVHMFEALMMRNSAGSAVRTSVKKKMRLSEAPMMNTYTNSEVIGYAVLLMRSLAVLVGSRLAATSA